MFMQEILFLLHLTAQLFLEEQKLKRASFAALSQTECFAHWRAGTYCP